MDPTLIGLLLTIVALAAVFFHFGFVRPESRGDGRLQAGFVALAFVLAPAVAGVLAQQAGAVGRLAHHGVAPLPGVRHAVGIAAGQGSAPTWVFAGRFEGASPLDFYDDPATRRGWQVGERGATIWVLRRGEARLTIATSAGGRASGGTVVYQLRP